MKPNLTPPYRRLLDPISVLNATVYDQARLLQNAVMLIDHLGLLILSISASPSPRNSHILVVDEPSLASYFPDAVEQRRTAEWSDWVAVEYGVEIHWIRKHHVTPTGAMQ